MATGPKVLYEFGPFRLDPEKQLLLRDDQPVSVTPKTLETLLVLVRHSREAVSKEELMKELWPDSFVEEANLSQNIFMLRKALGDTPEDRRYIVTLPGKGYRFAAEVRTVTENGEDVLVASRSQVVLEEGATDELALAGGARNPRRKYLVAIATIAVLASGGFFLLHRRLTSALPEKGSVLIGDFANTTGDPVFEGTLRQGLAVQLQQSPVLSVVSERRIQQTLRLMGRSDDARLTPEIAREICERTGTGAVIEGSIAGLGSRYVLGLRATDCRTGDVLANEQVQAANKEDVLNALSQMAGNVRPRLGESLASLKQHNTPLELATTSSLEALKAYSAGLRYSTSTGFAEALPQFKRAVELDPQFAAAYASLGLMYSARGEQELALESTTKAYELRNRASDREKFFITTLYHRDVTGNLEKEEETLKLWAQVYPLDRDAHGLLSGYAAQGLGQYERSIAEANAALAIDPSFVPGQVNIAFANLYLDRIPQAEQAVHRELEHKFEAPELYLLRYHFAFLERDSSAMEKAVAAASGKAGVEDWMWHSEALVFARSGKLQQARDLARQAIDRAQQAGDKERAATYQAAIAVTEALFGDSAAARKSAAAALKLANGRDVEYTVALALQLAGDSTTAQSLAADLEKRFPEDTSVKFNYLPALRALLALHQREPAKAVELLQVNLPYETAVPPIAFNEFFGAMYPVYARGQAYLATGRGREAAAEFHKILWHRGLVLGDPVGALAQVGLARAYAVAGDPAAARKSYEDFFVLWKDADADIPILKAARTEYAKLPRSA